jgi:thymidine kinase
MANQGKTVLISSLDGTFERKPFGTILNLIPKAEHIVKLSAVCTFCKKEASFTKRMVESKEIVLIGSDDIYKPVCRSCFY